VSNTKVHITKVSAILENGDAVLDLPPELVEELGWEVGDKLDYDVRDGNIYLTNKTKESRECHSTSNLPQQNLNNV
jgi:bifunctional DNA-binding transcriptional regulator/antitoxin component of YhaV-PrlF toxin-antitoxin module